MSFDSRLRDELRQATDAHDPREETALQHVKSAQPTEWADLTVVALEDSPRSKHTRAQRVVGALAAVALIAGAVALPFALRSHSDDPTAATATGQALTDGYTSTVVVRILPSISSTPATTTPAQRVAAVRAVQIALARTTQDAALAATHLGVSDPGTRLLASITGEGEISLNVIAPTRVGAITLARSWAKVIQTARIADAKRQARQQRHNLLLRVTQLHKELQVVDKQLAKLMPEVYGAVEQWDLNGGRHVPGPAPPPVPAQGSVKELNLAFERIQLLTSLTRSGEKAASLRIAQVKPDVYATLISQTPPRPVRSHRSFDISAFLIPVGLLTGGLLLLGSAFWLGRRTRRSPATVDAGGSP